MNKFKNKHKFIITNKIATMLVALVAILFSFMVFYRVKEINNGVFGGGIDWPSQHLVFIDFLRQNFWNTGEIFPDFTLLLGGGINFADLSYYGVMRPEVLISYLFPSIPSYTWVIVSYFGLYVLSGILCYRWLSIKTNNIKTSLFVTLIYLSSVVLFVHSIMHLMFTNYLSWIFLLFIGLDKYDENPRYKYVIILATTLLIFSSYYFAVGGLMIAGLYTLLDYKKGLKSVCSRVCYMFIGVLLSGFFLVPTIIETLGNSRERVANGLDIVTLLTPNLSFENLLIYSNDTAPSTSIIIMVAVLFNVLSKNKYIRNIGLLLLIPSTFRIVLYIFSGFDTTEAKILIPAFPVVLLNISYFFMFVKNKYREMIIATLITIVLCICYYLKSEDFIKIIFDLSLLFILVSVVCYYKKNLFLFIYLLIPMTLSFNQLSKSSKNMPITQEAIDNSFDPDMRNIVEEAVHENEVYRLDSHFNANTYLSPNAYQTTFYSSVLNRNYIDFIRNEVNVASGSVMHYASMERDPFALDIFGVKYILERSNEENNILGYNKNLQTDRYSVYTNDNVLPLAYVSYDNVDQEVYDSLSKAQKVDALTTSTVVDDGNVNYNSSLIPYTNNYEIIKKDEGLSFEQLPNGNIKVNNQKDGFVTIKLDKNILNQILMIDFDIENIVDPYNTPVYISMNGYTNTRPNDGFYYANNDSSFSYHLNNNQGFETIDILFSKGEYELSNIDVNLFGYDNIVNRKNDIEQIEVIETNGKENIISGKVNVKQGGYLVTSLPYQKGYSIIIDGKEVEVERINQGFVGSKISSGEHNIKIKYDMPGKAIGVVLSSLTFLTFGGYQLLNLVKNKNK